MNSLQAYIQHCMDLQLAVDPYKRRVLFESMDWLPKTHIVTWHISANQISTKHSPTAVVWYYNVVQFLYRGCFFYFCYFFLTRQYSCIACWKCVDSVSTLSQCSCHWFSDNTFGVKLDLVCHVIYPTIPKYRSYDIAYQGQIQNLRFCDGRNLGDIFICPEFPVVRLDTMNGFSEWTANVLS